MSVPLVFVLAHTNDLFWIKTDGQAVGSVWFFSSARIQSLKYFLENPLERKTIYNAKMNPDEQERAYQRALNKIRYSETAEHLFKRGNTKPFPTGLRIFNDELPMGGMRPGDVVEIYGSSGTGKTEMLLSILAQCILPPMWEGIEIGGNGVGVIFFDNDQKFSIFRLMQIIENKIRNTILSLQSVR